MTSGGKANGDREPEAFGETRRASGVRRLWEEPESTAQPEEPEEPEELEEPESAESTERELIVVRVRSAHAGGPDAVGPDAAASDEFDAGLRASGLRVIQTRGIEETTAVTEHYGAHVLLVDIEPASPADLLELCGVLLARYPDLPVCLRRGQDNDPALLAPLLVNLVESTPSTTLRVGNVSIDKHDGLVFVGKVHVKLTPCDVDILTLLFDRRGLVPDRELLALPCVNGTLESAKTNVRRLGKKLLRAGANFEIRRVRRRGFRVVLDESG